MARKFKQAELPGLSTKAAKSKSAEFHASLALSRWALKILAVASVESLSKLNEERLEGVDEETGNTRFFLEMTNGLFDFSDPRCPKETLKSYDIRIVNYWKIISANRRGIDGKTIRMKYFQWLTLMVTELYLDWYFNRRVELLAELNASVAEVNERMHFSERDKLPPVKAEDLNKIAFWEATGAGKTLMMQVNIMQFRFYAKDSGQKIERTILLTPNEGLTEQHLGELKASGFSGEILRAENKSDELIFKDTVYAIDSGKLVLGEDGGDGKKKISGDGKRMAVEWFGKNNLVMVDEGHHGHGKEDGEHRKCRNYLCEDGFAFEYSATFGQAVGGGDKGLWKLYARNILFDYSYKYFFKDGYGKEALILNQAEAGSEERRFEYLVGAMLAYYQQHRIWAMNPEVMREYGIEKPLCVFVGNTVNAGKDDGETVSDVRTLLRFLAELLNCRTEVEALFAQYLKDETVIEVNGRNPFYHSFVPIAAMSAHEIYADMLHRFFGVSSVQRLKIRHLKKPDEIALSVGAARAFGVVSIGNAAAFVADDGGNNGYDIESADEFSESAFGAINRTDSDITFLVGSRKFMEGWSSWRVSAMGLLNMGVNEGTQIIQLFGRGVRLKGKGFSLKRSQGKGVPKGVPLRHLETLNIFGIRANYMSRFREYLEQEGVSTRDQMLVIDFKTNKRPIPPGLLVPELKEGYRRGQKHGFQTQPITLFDLSGEDWKKMKQPVFVHDDFAYMQIMRIEDRTSAGSGLKDDRENQKIGCNDRIFDFIDWDRLYRRLLEVKSERNFTNLAIEKAKMINFVRKPPYEWYKLMTRKSDVTFDSFAKIASIQKLLETLLCGYMSVFYAAKQAKYESEHQVMVPLTADRLVDGYHFELNMEAEDSELWKDRLEELKKMVEARKVPAEKNIWTPVNSEDLVAILFERHLYEPLLYINHKEGRQVQVPFTMKPITLEAKSEEKFVRDLMAFYFDAKNAEFFQDVDLYLMRNPANKSKGIGFAQAGNFYPDFMLWLVNKQTQRQHLTFIDPKGLRNLAFDSPKLNFAQEIKNLEAQINLNQTRKLTLDSIILSDTSYNELRNLFKEHSKEAYEAKHIFFLEDGGQYLTKMFQVIKNSLSSE